MFRYSLFLLAGICIARYIDIPVWIVCLIGAISLSYLIFRFFKTTAQYQIHLLISISMVMICLGMLRMQLWQQHETGRMKQLRISSFPQKQSFQTQFEATVINSSSFEFFDTETFLVICKDTHVVLNYGDVFSTAKPASEIDAPAFPFEFDYKTYLFSNGITHKLELCSITKDTVHGLTHAFYQWIQASRVQFKKSTAQIFTTPESKGLAESLLLGYREELDRETKDSFLKSGVSHLLAVSGMHTALIYEMLFLIFLPFGSSQKHRFVFLATALFVLTYFTLLSGCSTSVLRASIMCSMFAVAYAFRKRGSGLNTLGTSILIILWFSPYQLWNLGFQLSVLAVIGILTLHQFISRQFDFKNRVSKYFFEGLSITVCAQLTTLPVVLYHFQSFPLYFIPANMVLIPISTIGLFASMISIFFVGLGIHFTWLFNCTQWIIELFANTATYFASLPNSSIQPIAFSAVEAILVAAILCTYIQFPFILKKKTLIAGILICISWTAFRIYNEYVSEHKTDRLFISHGKKSAILSINGLDATMYSQVPVKPFDKLKIKAFYNLRELNEYPTNSSYSGLAAEIPAHNLIWITRKNCTNVPLAIEHTFSYKEQDSMVYSAKKFHSLKVKSIVSLK
ncbi:ComEC/Rec2 family competence protein [Cytophaga aurantiaca]|uniref:ComEC/Rec2 family competence protein n=1 Tax=Cytophaga aurantiaca TaxID=29530 RepID=UPI0012F8256A|nr:ComEC/Rec2 family competence protein [Cytophaga aurantiaca]